MNRRRVVRVPASSANLGPGFDVFAAALALHMELEVEETGRFAVETNIFQKLGKFKAPRVIAARILPDGRVGRPHFGQHLVVGQSLDSVAAA